MITTIANAASLRIADNQFWEFADYVVTTIDVIDPMTGNILSTETVTSDAALWIDGVEDDGTVSVRVDQDGERFEGVLHIEPWTEVQLVGN